jgi:type IV secretion system protein VirD4
MNENVWPLILLGGGLLAFLLVVSFLSKNYSLNNFKSKTVGDGQHGTARWATPREISKTYRTVPFRPRRWRKGEDLPTEQGLVLGSVGGRNHKSEGGFLLKTSRKLLEKLRRPVEGKRKTKKKSKALSKVKKMIEEQRDIRALVDSDDVHCLMIGASGVGKTAFFLYPNLEYACACGMSYLALDTKGDLARNYGCIASKYYGYQVTVIDLRNPTCSDGFNFMTLVNHYMDRAKRAPNDLTAKAKAENYAKILAKTIISPEGSSQYGDNAFFYESAEGVLAAIVMLLAEFILPEKDGTEKRHIVSAFKLVQDLLAAPGGGRGKNGFHVLMDMLPSVHKARWVAGAALTAADQAMASVMSTVLSKLNAFLDSELEQVICRDNPIDAERFASSKCAIFVVIPEEDPTKNFIASLMIQNLSRELFSVADENRGRLKNRVVIYADEFGTMPPFDVLSLFSAGRSRGLTLVPIIQSLAQLEKNYGKEGAEIVCDNCQDTIFGGYHRAILRLRKYANR